MKDPLAEQGKVCLAIALSFDQFELGHVTFHHAIIDPPSEASSHRIFVFLDRSRKRLEFGKFAAFHLIKPAIKGLCSAGAQHLGKVLNQIIGPNDLWVDLTEFGQCLLLLDTQFFRSTKKQKSSLSSTC